MWLITDCCGIVCAAFTYFIVVSVYWGFVRIGVWDEIREGSFMAILQFLIFQYHCFLIFMSHFKCMTTDPGCLPKEIESLNFHKIPQQIQVLIRQVGLRMRHLENEIRIEQKEKNQVELLDRQNSINSNDDSTSNGGPLANKVENLKDHGFDIDTDELSDDENFVETQDLKKRHGWEKSK